LNRKATKSSLRQISPIKRCSLNTSPYEWKRRLCKAVVFNASPLLHVDLLVEVIEAQGIGGSVPGEILAVRGDPLGPFHVTQCVGGAGMDGEV